MHVPLPSLDQGLRYVCLPKTDLATSLVLSRMTFTYLPTVIVSIYNMVPAYLPTVIVSMYSMVPTAFCTFVYFPGHPCGFQCSQLVFASVAAANNNNHNINNANDVAYCCRRCQW